MPRHCYRIANGFVCGRLGEPCVVCHGLPEYLCDFPQPGGGTCDASLCERHAHEIGKNRHYCPQHHQVASGVQYALPLFGET